MTMDRTLRAHGGLKGTRSVMTRAERIAKMMEDGKFDPQKDCPLGLPKTKIHVSKAGSKSKKAAEETAAAEPPAEGGEAPAAAATGKKAE